MFTRDVIRKIEMIQEGMGKPDTKTTAFEIQYRIFENGQRIAAGCVVCLFCMEGWIVGALVAFFTIPLMHMGEEAGKELRWILNRKKSTI